MADLSTYTPIYIRTDGDDTTGDGSLGAPFATAQKGFETAYLGTGDFVLDLGEGVEKYVNLFAVSYIWPDTIAVRNANNVDGYTGSMSVSIGYLPNGDASGGGWSFFFKDGIPFTGTATDGRIFVSGSAIYEIRNGVTYLDGYIANGWYGGEVYIWWANKYYIAGVVTPLDSNGNGWATLNGSDYYFYVGGTATSLPESGTGSWSGGWYMGGCPSPLDSSGTGFSQRMYGYSHGGYGYCGVAGPTVYWRNGNPAQGWYNYGEGYSYFVGGEGSPLNENGNGWWMNGPAFSGHFGEGRYYIGGVATQLTESGTGVYDGNLWIGGVRTSLPESGTGWATLNGSDYYFYVGGVQTGLPESGTGWLEDQQKYYVAGAETTLDSNGNGYIDGQEYQNGQPYTPPPPDPCAGQSPSEGWNDSLCFNGYYINGGWTPLDSNGNGYIDGQEYQNGQPYTPPPDPCAGATPVEGWNAGPCFNGYYIGGTLTSLPESGTGAWNNTYYLAGVATQLDQNGNGFRNGLFYVGGVLANGPVQFTNGAGGQPSSINLAQLLGLPPFVQL